MSRVKRLGSAVEQLLTSSQQASAAVKQTEATRQSMESTVEQLAAAKVSESNMPEIVERSLFATCKRIFAFSRSLIENLSLI
ncbi:MAG: hypothetical protein AAGN15_21735 [Cyanobacteria bacterium J06581_3]